MGIFLAHCSSRKYTSKYKLEAAEQAAEFIEPVRITSGIDSNFLPSLSPNGAFVLFTSDRANNKDIWEKSSVGGYPRMITTHSADDFGAVISPDGRKAAFVSRRAEASGDIHILDLTASIAGALSRNEGLIKQIELKDSEDINPAWFPNSKRLVFSARRPGETKSRLMTAELGSLKAEPLGKIFGEQPAVSPDGNWVAYIFKSSLYVFSQAEQKSYQLTSGTIIQDGQPQFSQDGKAIYFIRYTDDTNGDFVINGDDRSSIWRLNFDRQRRERVLENYNLTPLTSARRAVYSPNHRPPNLYFTQQTAEGIDIFSLPASGQIKISKTLAGVLTQFDAQENFYDKLFIIRRAQNYFAEKNRTEELKQLINFEIEWLIENGKTSESRWVESKIQDNFADDKAMVASLEISLLSQSIIQHLFPYNREPLNDEDAGAVRRRLEQLDRIDLTNANHSDAASGALATFVLAKRAFLQGQILISLGDFKGGQEKLREIENIESGQPGKWGKEAALLSAELAQSISDPNFAFNLYADLFTRFGADKNFCEKASLSLLQNLEAVDLKTKIKELTKLKIKTQDLPCVPVFVQARLADAFLEDKKVAIAINELQEILTSNKNNPSLLLKMSERLALLLENDGRFSEAEKIYRSLLRKLEETAAFALKANDLYTEFLLRKAARLVSTGELDEAIGVYRKILRRDEGNVAANKGLIDIKFLQKKIDEQIEAYKEDIQGSSPTARKLFFLGYALAYKIDAEKDLANKLQLLDDCILLLERARQKNAQIPEVAQKLGVLYDLKDSTIKAFYAAGGMRAFNRKFWLGTKDFFGFEEPQWLELALDSFLSAYFLSEEDSTRRIDILTNLGDAFYKLGIYPKSLNYYMLRLKSASTTPLKSRNLEALICYKAARAAYYSDDLKVAESLQRRALDIWQDLKVDEEIARALDYLAFIMREQKRFEDASIVYKRLLQVHYRLGNKWNILGTQLNLAYTYWQSNQLSTALVVLAKADENLQRFERKKNDKEDASEGENIKVDIGGQATAAKGFDVFKRRLLFLTIQEKVYANQGLYEMALASLKDKRRRLRAQQKDAKGRPDNYLQEDLAVLTNNMGNINNRKADLAVASELYLEAAEHAKALNGKDGNLTSAEWLNKNNHFKTQVRLADLGVLNRASIKALGKEMETLRASVKEKSKSDKRDNADFEILAGLDIHKAKLLVINDEKGKQSSKGDKLQPILNQVRKYSRYASVDSDVLDFAYLNLDFYTLKEIKANIAAQRSQFRKRALSNDAFSWKFYANSGLWMEAYRQLEDKIKQGMILDNVSDQLLLRKIFENAWLEMLQKNKVKTSEGNLFFREYVSLYLLELANRSFRLNDKPNAKVLAKLKPLLAIRSDDIEAALQADEFVLSVYSALDGTNLHVMLQGKGFHRHLESQKPLGGTKFGIADVESLLATADLRLDSVKRVYLVPFAETYAWEWEKLQLAGQTRPLAFIPSVECLPALKNWQHLAKENIGHLTSVEETQSSTSNDAKESIRVGAKGLSYQRIRKTNKKIDPLNLKRFNLIHVDERLILNDYAPAFSAVEIKTHAKQSESKKYFLSLGLLGELNLRNAALLAFANVDTARNKTFEKSWNPSQGWLAIALASLAAEIPTTILSNEKAEVSAWQRFYAAIQEMSFSEAAIDAQLPARIIGFAGANAQEEAKLAPTAVTNNLAQAERAFESNDVERAISHYKNALYYARRLKNQRIIDSVLRDLVKMYVQANDFSSALFYKRQIAERARVSGDGSTSTTYAKHLLEAGSFALNERDYGGAEAIFAEAKTILENNNQFDLLAELYRYEGIIWKKQKQYDRAIALFNQAKDNFGKSKQLENAQLCDLEIARIYFNEKHDFHAALSVYKRVGEGLQNLSTEKNYPLVLAEMSDLYRAWGRPGTALQMLRDAEYLLDKSNFAQRIELWGRLVAIYVDAGLLSQAQNILDLRRKYNNKLFPLILQKQKATEDFSLQGNIWAKDRKFSDAEKAFNDSINAAKNSYFSELAISGYLRLSELFLQQGNSDRGLAVLKDLKEYTQELLDKTDMRAINLQQAMLTFRKGEFEAAEKFLEDSQNKNEQLEDERDLLTLFAKAEIDYAQRDFASAKKSLQHLVAKAMQLGDVRLWLQSEVALGLIADQDGDKEIAKSHYEKGMSFLTKFPTFQSDEPRFTNYALALKVDDLTRRFVSILVQQKQTQMAWRYSLLMPTRQQSLSLSVVLRASAFMGEVKTRLYEAQALGDELFRHAIKNDMQAFARQTEFEAVVANIRSDNPALAALFLLPDMQQNLLAKQIKPEEILVNYFLSEQKLFIWTLDASGRLIFTLGDSGREKIQEKITEHQKLMRNLASVKTTGDELSEILLKPIEDLIKDKQQLRFVANPELLNLGFASLPANGGYLLDSHEVVYVNPTHSTDASVDPNIDGETRTLAFTDQVAQSPSEDRLNIRLKVAQIGERFFSHSSTESVTKLKAKESAVQMRSADILHLAVAPTVLSNQALDFGIRLQNEDTPGLQITALDLSRAAFGAKLVVFSQDLKQATNDSIRAQVWQALRQLCSLNNSRYIFANTLSAGESDVTSALLTKRIYKELKAGSLPRKALRQAQLYVKKIYQHPAYWSGYQLNKIGI